MCPECQSTTQYRTEQKEVVRSKDPHENRTYTYYKCSGGHEWKEGVPWPCPRPACPICMSPQKHIVIFGNARARETG